MPIIVEGELLNINRVSLSKATMKQLIALEQALWEFMHGSPPNVVHALNNIYQEVEWRAAHPHQKT
jgi:hypothetical protein